MKPLLASFLLLTLNAANAQSWPQQPVRMIVPAPAGSSLDIIVRTLGEKLKERWKQPLIVENKAGAGGMLGMDVVAKAAPDGYTLGIGFNGPVAFAPHSWHHRVICSWPSLAARIKAMSRFVAPRSAPN